CCLLWDDAVPEGLELRVSGDVDAGDVAGGESHEELDERGRESRVALGSGFGGCGCGASGGGLPSGDGGTVVAPCLVMRDAVEEELVGPGAAAMLAPAFNVGDRGRRQERELTDAAGQALE